MLSLDDPRAASATAVGAKAAVLARLRASGLSVLTGFVVGPHDTDPAIRLAYEQLTADCSGCAVVARSSADDEDSALQSFAGQYASVLDIADCESLLNAVSDVRASRDSVTAAEYRLGDRAVMHVLVQPMLAPIWSGVAFSADPLGTPGLVVEAVPGHLADLVQGRVVPEHLHLRSSGLDRSAGDDSRPLPEVIVNAVVGTLSDVRDLLGTDVDVEWAVRSDGELVVLQARPAPGRRP